MTAHKTHQCVCFTCLVERVQAVASTEPTDQELKLASEAYADFMNKANEVKWAIEDDDERKLLENLVIAHVLTEYYRV